MKIEKVAKPIIWVLSIAVLSLIVAGFLGFVKFPAQAGVPGTAETPKASAVGAGTFACPQTPAYTYSAVDSYGTATLGGTDYIKQGADKPVTSLASPTFGKTLQYWRDNVTNFVTPQGLDGSITALCGGNSIQARGFLNGSVSVAMYTQPSNTALVALVAGASTQNVTVGANDVQNLKVTYTGTGKKSAMPFGGCVAVEVPSTITAVSLNGAGISSNTACPYQWTYTVSSTSNVVYKYAVPAGFDANGLADLKEIAMQLQSGSSNPVGSGLVAFQPANYYVTNGGEIAIGIEKDKNQDTTKAFGTTINSFSFGIN